MSEYWITVSVPAESQDEAELRAQTMIVGYGGRVIEVQPEPPQGATIVGDMHEDELA